MLSGDAADGGKLIRESIPWLSPGARGAVLAGIDGGWRAGAGEPLRFSITALALPWGARGSAPANTGRCGLVGNEVEACAGEMSSLGSRGICSHKAKI